MIFSLVGIQVAVNGKQSLAGDPPFGQDHWLCTNGFLGCTPVSFLCSGHR